MPVPVVFVNFRSDDEPYVAALIDEKLSDRFGSHRVFRSSKSIRAGEVFDREIMGSLRRCSVLLAVIGPRWLAARDENGEATLFRDDDWVRREIAEALRCGIRVVPVMVGNTPRLNKHDLPVDIAGLADRQCVHIRHRHIADDVNRLIQELTDLVAELAENDPAASSGPRPPAAARPLPGVPAPSSFSGLPDVADRPLFHASGSNVFVGETHVSGDVVAGPSPARRDSDPQRRPRGEHSSEHSRPTQP